VQTLVVVGGVANYAYVSSRLRTAHCSCKSNKGLGLGLEGLVFGLG